MKKGSTVISHAERGHCHPERPMCHPEFISGSNKRTPAALFVSKYKDVSPRQQMLKQVQHDMLGVQDDRVGAQGAKVGLRIKADARFSFYDKINSKEKK